MPKRSRDPASNSENVDEFEGGVHHKQARRSVRKPKLCPALYKASVRELAHNTNPDMNSTADVDIAIVSRIKKCLARANHPSAAEAEAKAALYLASRLMAQHNISRAEVLAHESPTEQAQHAGESTVSILRVDGDQSKTVMDQSYTGILGYAMNSFFECRLYSTSRLDRLDYTFYGIAENTVAAAMAFETSYNLVSEWSRPYKGRGSKNSYCLGASNELFKMAETKRADEEKEAKKSEKDALEATLQSEILERQAQIARLAPLPDISIDGSATNPIDVSSENGDIIDHETPREHSMDDDDNDSMDWAADAAESDDSDYDGLEPDFKVEDDVEIITLEDIDDAISKLAKTVPSVKPEPTVKTEPSEEPVTPFHGASGMAIEPTPVQQPDMELELKWGSHMQLVVFRKKAATIAEDYLKSTGLKLGKCAQRRDVIRDQKAYDQGVKDGRKVDIFRKRIEERKE